MKKEVRWIGLLCCAQSCPTLCDPMDWSLPGSSIHGIFQAKMLEWVAISYSRGSSWSRDGTHVSCISCLAGGFFATMPHILRPKSRDFCRPFGHVMFLHKHFSRPLSHRSAYLSLWFINSISSENLQLIHYQGQKKRELGLEVSCKEFVNHLYFVSLTHL